MLQLDPNTLAIRAVYRNLVEREILTVVFRPGVRRAGSFRAYSPGQIVTARILSHVGADWAALAPRFFPDLSRRVEITDVLVLPIDSLNENHFRGCSPDITDASSLKYHLGLIYNIPMDVLESEFFVTRIQYCYKKA